MTGGSLLRTASALVLLAPSAPGQDRSGAEDVLLALDRREITVEAASARLLQDGPPLDVLLDVLAGGVVHGSDGRRALSGDQRDALLGAARRHPPGELDRVLAAVGADSPPGIRRAALALARQQPDRSRLPSAIEWVADDWGTGVARDFEELVTATLSRDGAAASDVRGLLAERDAPYTEALLRSVGRWPDERALALVSTRLYDDLPHLALALRQVEALAPLLRYADPSLAADVRRSLTAPDPAVRAAAAGAAAALEDRMAIEQLIELVGDDHALVRGAAKRTLQELGGVRLGSDADRWRSWLSRERRWWEERGARVLEGLAGDDPLEVAGALAEAAGHPVHRERLAPAVAGLLSSPHDTHRRLACHALAELGARGWTEALIPLLEDGDGAVEQAAWSALGRLTLAELPPDAAAWRDWHESR